jgi:hypothetical protein
MGEIIGKWDYFLARTFPTDCEAKPLSYSIGVRVSSHKENSGGV